MKKTILNLGKTLNKTEQQSINGGFGIYCGPEICDNLPSGESPVDLVYVCVCN